MWVSTVTDSPADATETLSASSVALAVIVWVPLPSTLVATLQLPLPSAVVVARTVTPSVSYSVTMLFASAVPLSVGVVAVVIRSVAEIPVSGVMIASIAGAAGAVVSIVTGSAVDASDTFPATSVALAVMLWLPSPSVLVATVQAPLPSAVAVARTVVPSVSYSVTRLPGSAVPCSVGVASSVIRSVAELPVSGLIVAAITGAAGPTVSMVTDRAADAVETLPATSVAFAVMAWAPSARVPVATLQLPPSSAVVVASTVTPPVS